MAIVNKAEVGKGFWIGLGVLLVLFLWGLVTGQLGKLRAA